MSQNTEGHFACAIMRTWTYVPGGGWVRDR